jgi:ABC-type Co2+ transport system permease subunit
MFKLFVVFLLPFSIDLFFCYLDLKRNYNNKGASGVPIVTLFLYVIIILNYPSTILSKIILLSIAFLLHWMLLFAIPTFHRQYLKK